MASSRYLVGARKGGLYLLIAVHVALHYALRPGWFSWNPIRYGRFLCRALRLLLVFRANKVVRVAAGYKLHLYLPAYPTRAFFGSIESKLVRTPPGPTTIVFSITKACSYRCPHCYQRHDGGADLDEEVMLSVAGKLQEVGVTLFDIEGGEPSLRFPRLLRLVESLDDRSEVWVNTTGARFDAGMLDQLKQVGLFGLMVCIHSPDAGIHDAFTGVPGSFDVACETVRRCREAGMAAALNTVLSERELWADGLVRLMELARALDCDYVQLIHPKPAGGWLGQKEGMQGDPELVRSVQQAHVVYNSGGMRDYPSLSAQVYEESAEMLGCTAGAVDRFYVNAHGELQPCEFLNISFGNVNEEPFEEVFERMRRAFSEPCTDWLCCTQAPAIQERIAAHEPPVTPLPWAETQGLVETWDRGAPTPVYRRLGIYR